MILSDMYSYKSLLQYMSVTTTTTTKIKPIEIEQITKSLCLQQQKSINKLIISPFTGLILTDVFRHTTSANVAASFSL